jgi:hypothetical protein
VTHDVHVFGDSHWRVFFPFVNHGAPGVTYEQDGIRYIDMVANELSGATMYGLLNDASRNGARARILGDLDRIGPVENVGLVFGEVDARYHSARYVRPDGAIDGLAVLKSVLRYKQFIDNDLLGSDRVTGCVFVYYGFCYPQFESTPLQPGILIGDGVWDALNVHDAFMELLPDLLPYVHNRVHVIANCTTVSDQAVSDDGVHLRPDVVFPLVHSTISTVFR